MGKQGKEIPPILTDPFCSRWAWHRRVSRGVQPRTGSKNSRSRSNSGRELSSKALKSGMKKRPEKGKRQKIQGLQSTHLEAVIRHAL